MYRTNMLSIRSNGACSVRFQYGDTPLHTATRYGHAGVVRILVSAFCNVQETNRVSDAGL